MATLGVGLLGHGMAGRIIHAPLIAAAPGLTLRAVATSRGEAVRAAFPDAHVDADPAAVIAHPGVDLVVIATPNHTHRPLAEVALAAGRHVVVDKPFALDTTEADALIAAARKAGRVLSVFQNRRWDGDYLTVKALIASGRLGRIALAEMHWDRFRPAIKPGWREAPGPGSGVLNDLGSHLVDQALCLFGAPDALSADIAAQREGAVADDYFALTLHHAAMRVVLSASTLAAKPRPRFALYGDKGSFVKYGVDGQEAQLRQGIAPGDPDFGDAASDAVGRFIGPDGVPQPVETARGRYADYYPAIAAAIAGDAPVPVDPADVRRVMRVLDLARESAGAGRRIAFSD